MLSRFQSKPQTSTFFHRVLSLSAELLNLSPCRKKLHTRVICSRVIRQYRTSIFHSGRYFPLLSPTVNPYDIQCFVKQVFAVQLINFHIFLQSVKEIVVLCSVPYGVPTIYNHAIISNYGFLPPLAKMVQLKCVIVLFLKLD